MKVWGQDITKPLVTWAHFVSLSPALQWIPPNVIDCVTCCVHCTLLKSNLFKSKVAKFTFLIPVWDQRGFGWMFRTWHSVMPSMCLPAQLSEPIYDRWVSNCIFKILYNRITGQTQPLHVAGAKTTETECSTARIITNKAQAGSKPQSVSALVIRVSGWGLWTTRSV